jgi:hypothetical protein
MCLLRQHGAAQAGTQAQYGQADQETFAEGIFDIHGVPFWSSGCKTSCSGIDIAPAMYRAGVACVQFCIKLFPPGSYIQDDTIDRHGAA